LADHTPDYIISLALLIVIAVYGIKYRGKQKTFKDYFLGLVKVPQRAIYSSIVADETINQKFISVPEPTSFTNLIFHQQTFESLFPGICLSNY
jgi:hypothetical protein